MKTNPPDSSAEDGATAFYRLYPAGHLYFHSFIRLGNSHWRSSVDGTSCFPFCASSLPLVSPSLFSSRPWNLPSNVVGNLHRHLQSSINGLQLDSKALAPGFAMTSNAFRGAGTSKDAIGHDPQASIFLGSDFDVKAFDFNVRRRRLLLSLQLANNVPPTYD